MVLRLATLALVATTVLCEVYFKEEFLDDSWKDRWVISKHKDGLGEWKLSHGKFYGDAKRDKGLQTSQDSKFYSISSKFPSFSNKGKTLVIQYTVKHEQSLDCGGGYVKVMPGDINQEDFHGDTVYNIMFGPDICGSYTKKVHVIFNYKGKNHLIKKDIRCKDDELTHLYTLILNPDNTYEVQIDGERVEGGDLESDLDLIPPKKIQDPDAKKPEDWDDKEYIDDPDDKKPKGCRGKWIHPEIDNPEYTPDDELYLYKDIGAIGFDIWQVKSGTIFDNIFITDSVEEAKAHAAKNFDKLKKSEEKMQEKHNKEEKKHLEEGLKKRKTEEKEKKTEDHDEL